MKFLSSSSSSASSSSDNTIFTSKSAPSGCLAGMIRRLLCFHILPTHPFDHIKESDKEFEETNDKFETLAHPGIVARLMGLDSMPRINQTGPNSIARSRSLNSVDTWKEIELMQGTKHRRVNSTQSMREVPSFLELKTEEFFILSFEGGGKGRELELKPRKSRKGEFKEKRTENWRNKENQELAAMANSHSCDSKDEDSITVLRPTKGANNNLNLDIDGEVVKQSKKLCETESGRRRRSRKKSKESYNPLEKVETECASENSSPVSVLDFAEFPIDQDVPNSGKVDSGSKNSNSRRKLSGELESFKHASPCNTINSNNANSEANKTEERCIASRKNSFHIQNFAEIWAEICKLAETETTHSSRTYKEIWKGEEFEEIGVKFELEILDQLILEMIDLIYFHMKQF